MSKVYALRGTSYNAFLLATTDEFCAYEEYENVTIAHVEQIHQKKSKSECQRLCDNTTSFNCRGYTIVPNENMVTVNQGVDDKYTCLIHSEDSKINGPSSFVDASGAKYYEVARCLNGKYFDVKLS